MLDNNITDELEKANLILPKLLYSQLPLTRGVIEFGQDKRGYGLNDSNQKILVCEKILGIFVEINGITL